MEKKKGFTLVEVLVVIMVSTLVLALVGGTMVFVTTTMGDLIEESEEIDMAKNIEKYLRSLPIESRSACNLNGKDLEYNGEIVFEDTSLSLFIIIENQGFLKCYLEFDSGRRFEFILNAI